MPGETPTRPQWPMNYLHSSIGALASAWSRRKRPMAATRLFGRGGAATYTPAGILEAWPIEAEPLLQSWLDRLAIYARYLRVRVKARVRMVMAGIAGALAARMHSLRFALPFDAATTGLPRTYTIGKGARIDWDEYSRIWGRRAAAPFVLLLCAGLLLLILHKPVTSPKPTPSPSGTTPPSSTPAVVSPNGQSASGSPTGSSTASPANPSGSTARSSTLPGTSPSTILPGYGLAGGYGGSYPAGVSSSGQTPSSPTPLQPTPTTSTPQPINSLPTPSSGSGGVSVPVTTTVNVPPQSVDIGSKQIVGTSPIGITAN